VEDAMISWLPLQLAELGEEGVTMDTSERWWDLRKGSTALYVEWGPANGIVFATDL
jgi:hypothetical protein